jgi:hypothetical protein
MPYYPVPFVQPGVDIAPADAAVTDVTAPRTFFSIATPIKTGTMPIVALDPASNAYPAGRHAGAASLSAIEIDLMALNILAGINIFGVVGSHGYFDRWIPATIFLSDPVAVIETPDQTDNEPAPISSVHVETTGDLPASGIKLLEPAIGLTDAEAIETPDQTDAEAAPLATAFDLIQVLEGAVADDGGATTDESAQAKSAAANDMHLLPAAPADDDAYYFGSDYKFDELILNLGTAGNGVWSIVWEYYDVDTTWHALAGLVDGTNQFKAAAGNRSVTFTKDANWTAVAVGGVGPMYWIRARMDAFTSIVTQPLGTQAWYKITL